MLPGRARMGYLACLVLAAGASALSAQPPLAFPPSVPPSYAQGFGRPMPFPLMAQPQPAAPRQQLPPLFYVRFTGPQGVKIMFYRNGPKGQTFDVPVTVGMRPGYRYRMQVKGMPEFPDVALTPTIEVRGTLMLANRMRASQFPAGLYFDQDDFEAVKSGALVTKVVTLERPDTALPMAMTADRPVQITVAPGRDPMEEAKEHGRPMLIMHFGPRPETPEEMARQTLAGTLLLPGEAALGPPAYAPAISYSCLPLHDPVLGPRDPNEEIKLYDGGDAGSPAGFGPTGRLTGVEPADTVAEYLDSRGHRRLAVSNRVGLCVPRFLVTRGQARLAGEQSHFALGGTRSIWANEITLATRNADARHQNVQIEGLGTRVRPSGTHQDYTTGVFGRIDGLSITGSIKHPARMAGRSVDPPPPEPLDRPLKIDKWPDRCNATLGEIVTLTIKYSNFGGNPITGIVIADSLVARFEYVGGSAKTDREALFTTQPNDAGSVTLRWEITDPLPPRQTGMVSFQVRIR